MTGLEPHPIFALPTREQAERNPEGVKRVLQARAERIELERINPAEYGFEPEIWHLVDDLLVEGAKVTLDVTRIEKLSAFHSKPLPDVPITIIGEREVYIAGSNRSSKSEYAGKKCLKVLRSGPGKRGWSFADTGPISIARQQPIFWRYMPLEIKRMASQTGKARQGVTLNISYKQKTGFAEQSFVLDNASQHWFKNYEQDIEWVEGDQLDVIWADECRDANLIRRLRTRTIDRDGLLIVTFTAAEEKYASMYNEYERGARTLLEVEAELLPIKRPRKIHFVTGDPSLKQAGKTRENSNSPLNDPGNASVRGQPERTRNGADTGPVAINPEPVQAKRENANKLRPDEPLREDSGSRAGENLEYEIIGYKKVARVKVAGPGSDGDQRANIVYFHITDNPYFGYERGLQRANGKAFLFGKERYYRAYRNATENKILARVYGILTTGSAQQFPKFSHPIHTVDPDRIPAKGTNYLIVDPVDGRNWYMLWIRVDERGHHWVYREWPSTGHINACIPGYGDIGPWTLPGAPPDGVQGPGQRSLGFGLYRYKEEIYRCEGRDLDKEEREKAEAEKGARTAEYNEPLWRVRKIPAAPKEPEAKAPAPAERISQRWMDSRYGNTPTTLQEGQTTLIEEMRKIGMEFLAASGRSIEEGTVLINGLLDYDPEVELGAYSPRFSRLNEPMLHVSRECQNLIYSLREWTGKDKNRGACKDPIDCLRYAMLAELRYIGEESYTFIGGGCY